MCGWLSAASALASRSNLAMRSASAATASGRALIATSRRSFVSRARYTSPMPPAPSGPSTSNDPMREPAVSGTRTLELWNFGTLEPSPRAYVTEVATATAVLHILQLDEQSIWIREVELGCPLFGAAAILHPHGHVRRHGSDRPCCTAARLDAVAFQGLEDAIHVEVVHVHTNVIDGRRPRRRATGRRCNRRGRGHHKVDPRSPPPDESRPQ